MKVSVVVPVCNMEDTVEKTVQSIVENIEIEDYECIIVDTGSTDRTCEICIELQKNNKHISFAQMYEATKSEAMNLGMNIALGEYLYFIDGDFLLCANFIIKAIDCLDENKNVDIFARKSYVTGFNNQIITNLFFENKIGPLLPLCVFRKSAINVKFENEICNDIIFSGKILYKNQRYYIDYSNESFTVINNLENNFNEIDYTKLFDIDWLKYAQEEITKFVENN